MFGFIFEAYHFWFRPHVIAWPILLLWIANLVAASDRAQALAPGTCRS